MVLMFYKTSFHFSMISGYGPRPFPIRMHKENQYSFQERYVIQLRFTAYNTGRYFLILHTYSLIGCDLGLGGSSGLNFVPFNVLDPSVNRHIFSHHQMIHTCTC